MDTLEPIHALSRAAAEARASDLFLQEGELPRIRVDGALRALNGAEVVSRQALLALWRACRPEGSAEAPAFDVDLDAHWESRAARFRVNLHRHVGRLGASLRVIQTRIPDMESLHLPAPILRAWAQRAHGLVLVTGPTGCGKSTTVASLLDWMNGWFEGHVVTIEEPIEYLFSSRSSLFTQREIPEDVPNYTTGLRSALRQSPDVIFMGEIRDFESAKIAVQAAETGHLVLTTMHTSSVVETIERLASLVPPDERRAVLSLLASQLIGVLAQKLLLASTSEGRHLVTEFFQNEGATRDWILDMDYARLEDHVSSPQSPSCQSFRSSLLDAWRAGEVSREAALDAAANPQELDRLMRGVS